MQIRGSTGSTCSTMLANALFIRVSCTTSYLNVLPLRLNFYHFFRFYLIFSDQISDFIITFCTKIKVINWLITPITTGISFNIDAHRMS